MSSISLPPLYEQSSLVFKATKSFIDYAADCERAEKAQLVQFDSRTRQKDVFPYASDFKTELNGVDMGKVSSSATVSVKLTSLEFAAPGSSAAKLVSMTGVSWQNDNEASIGYPTYTAYINPGLYTIDTITSELARVMNAVPRKLAIDGQIQNHTWSISMLSNPLNGLIFYNIILTSNNVPQDPVNTVADSTLVTITQIKHGFAVNDIVYLQNVTGNPGGVPDSVLNAAFNIVSVPDEDNFVILVSITPYSSASGGGASVRIGHASKFAFVEGPKDTPSDSNLMQLLGFPRRSAVSLMNTMTLDDLREVISNSADSHILHIPSSIAQKWPFAKMTNGVTMFYFQNAESVGVRSNVPFSVTNNSVDNFTVTYPADMEIGQTSSLYSPQDSLRLQLFSDANRENWGADLSQTNVFSTVALFRSINLSGDTYAFIYLNNKQLAKVQLISAAGYYDFNAFIVSTPIFTSEELSFDKEMRLTLLNAAREPMFFAGIEYSGSIELQFSAPQKPAFLLA